MFGKVLIHHVQVKGAIMILSELMDHIVKVNLSLRKFNIYPVIYFSQWNMCYNEQNKEFGVYAKQKCK